MDAGKFYALLRFEEAAIALRVVMRLGLVDRMSGRSFSRDDLRETLEFTEQAARTFFPLLQVMEILEMTEGAYRVPQDAAACLADGISTSRKPYLSIGTGADVDALINLLKGEQPAEALPLYSEEGAGQTVMDDTEMARDIALGLASRARNFADPLAAAVAHHAPNATSIADIGAGSPYVANACLHAIRGLEKVILVDRANGMRFAREVIQSEQIEASRLEFHEGDFFDSVPAADVYVLSNAAHDWQVEQYSVILKNIRKAITNQGVVCIHEPVLKTSWGSDAEWIDALWMACYAMTLFRITVGEGTSYSVAEHHGVLATSGFVPGGTPVPPSDGCTALFYSVEA